MSIAVTVAVTLPVAVAVAVAVAVTVSVAVTVTVTVSVAVAVTVPVTVTDCGRNSGLPACDNSPSIDLRAHGDRLAVIARRYCFLPAGCLRS